MTLLGRPNNSCNLFGKSLEITYNQNWSIILLRYDMQFIPQKVIKEQGIADFLVEHHVPESFIHHKDIPYGMAKVMMPSIL